MSALLQKLGVPRNVRLFFEPYLEALPDGSLTFPFGNAAEQFDITFHLMPTATDPWIAGSGPLLFYSHSAMEAIAFLSLNNQRFPDLSLLRFVAIGYHLPQLPRLAYHKCALLFGSDTLGKLWDIRAAVQLCGKQVNVSYSQERYYFKLPDRSIILSEDRLSLQSFERAAGLRSGIRTYKPAKPYPTFLQLLIKTP